MNFLAEMGVKTMSFEDVDGLFYIVLDLLDADASGKITFDEFAMGCLSLIAFASLPSMDFATEEERFDYVFNVMDVDGSGFLEEREIHAFVRIVRRLGGMLPEEQQYPFWKLSQTSTLAVVKSLMADADENKDGKISRSEFPKLGRRLQLRKVVTKMETGSGMYGFDFRSFLRGIIEG